MLRGMGFGNDTSIYLASGKIYNADRNLAPLLEMFPLLQTKETLASDEELAPFKVCLLSQPLLLQCVYLTLFWEYTIKLTSVFKG